MLLLILGGAILKQNKPKKNSPTSDITLSKKKIESTLTVKDPTSASTVSPPLPTPPVSVGDFNNALATFLKNLNTSSVKNIAPEDLQDEIQKIQSFLEEEEVIQKLNANQISKEDREKLNVVFLRLQSLQEVNINRTLYIWKKM
jgi:hypothetical protein